jgi:hypothetical protein
LYLLPVEDLEFTKFSREQGNEFNEATMSLVIRSITRYLCDRREKVNVEDIVSASSEITENSRDNDDDDGLENIENEDKDEDEVLIVEPLSKHSKSSVGASTPSNLNIDSSTQGGVRTSSGRPTKPIDKQYGVAESLHNNKKYSTAQSAARWKKALLEYEKLMGYSYEKSKGDRIDLFEALVEKLASERAEREKKEKDKRGKTPIPPKTPIPKSHDSEQISQLPPIQNSFNKSYQLQTPVAPASASASTTTIIKEVLQPGAVVPQALCGDMVSMISNMNTVDKAFYDRNITIMQQMRGMFTEQRALELARRGNFDDLDNASEGQQNTPITEPTDQNSRNTNYRRNSSGSRRPPPTQHYTPFAEYGRNRYNENIELEHHRLEHVYDTYDGRPHQPFHANTHDPRYAMEEELRHPRLNRTRLDYNRMVDSEWSRYGYQRQQNASRYHPSHDQEGFGRTEYENDEDYLEPSVSLRGRAGQQTKFQQLPPQQEEGRYQYRQPSPPPPPQQQQQEEERHQYQRPPQQQQEEGEEGHQHQCPPPQRQQRFTRVQNERGRLNFGQQVDFYISDEVAEEELEEDIFESFQLFRKQFPHRPITHSNQGLPINSSLSNRPLPRSNINSRPKYPPESQQYYYQPQNDGNH